MTDIPRTLNQTGHYGQDGSHLQPLIAVVAVVDVTVTRVSPRGRVVTDESVLWREGGGSRDGDGSEW